MQNYFIKIKLLCNLADAIVDFGQQCGYTDLMDRTDMTCGAVPEGSFQQVIDPGAPEQFLALYARIAASRFAFAVTQVLRISEECLPPIRQFLFETGRNNQLEESVSPEDALCFLETVILDEMPGKTPKILQPSVSGQEICWRLSEDFQQEIWEKQGGNPEVFRLLLKSFVDGLLEKSGVVFEIESDGLYSLKKK